jgi:hypothetical protein
LLGVGGKTDGMLDAKVETYKSVRCMIEAGCDVGNSTGSDWADECCVSLVVDECTMFCHSSAVTNLCCCCALLLYLFEQEVVVRNGCAFPKSFVLSQNCFVHCFWLGL